MPTPGLHDRRSGTGARRSGDHKVGLIAGLTSAGVRQDQAVAAVFIERLYTAYLPLIRGWGALFHMRRRDYV